MELYSEVTSEQDDDGIDSQMAEFEGALQSAESLQSEVESAMSDLGDRTSNRGKLDDMFRRFDTQLEPFLSPAPAPPAKHRRGQNDSGNARAPPPRGSPSRDEAARLAEVNAAKEVSDARIASLEAELSRLRGQVVFDGNTRQKQNREPAAVERLNIVAAASADAPPAYGDVGAANRAVTDAELNVLEEAEQLRSVVLNGLEEFVGEGDLEGLAWQAPHLCPPPPAPGPVRAYGTLCSLRVRFFGGRNRAKVAPRTSSSLWLAAGKSNPRASRCAQRSWRAPRITLGSSRHCARS